jgi:hypothetical protein
MEGDRKVVIKRDAEGRMVYFCKIMNSTSDSSTRDTLQFLSNAGRIYFPQDVICSTRSIRHYSHHASRHEVSSFSNRCTSI